MLKFYFYIVIASLFASSLTAKADGNIPEQMFNVGVYGGYNFNVHYADFNKLRGIANCCDKFTGGTGSGFSFGALFEYPIKKDLLIGLRVGYSTLDAQLLRNKAIGNTPVISGTQTVITDIMVDHTIDSRISILTIEPNLCYKFYDRLNTYVGLRISPVMSATFDQQEKIISPGNVTFLDGRVIQNDRKGLELPDKTTMLYHAMIGVGYELPVSKFSYLEPMIDYYLPLNNVSSVDWKASTFLLGLTYRMLIFPPKVLPVIYDTLINRDTIIKEVAGLKEEKIERISSTSKLVEDEKEDVIVQRTIITEQYEKSIPKIMGLATSIEAYGISKDGSKEKNPTIVIEETDTEEGFPLLPHVFFKEGSANLLESDMHLLKKNETAKFNEDSVKWNTMAIYAELLNIAGYRLKKYSAEAMTITGCNNNTGSEKNNLQLSAQRAESIKKYLTDVWGISANRITIQRQNLPDNPGNTENPDGRIENQRAELKFKNIDLLKPVYLKEILRSSNPPLVEIVPTVQSEAGLKNYSINVEQKGRRLRNYDGETLPDKLVWQIEDKPLPETEAPINITLTAKDKLNQQSKASTELKLQQLTIKKKRYERKDDKRIERFFLIVFDFDKADIKAHHKIILNQIKSKIMPNSKVTISGYTDRTGEMEYNLELARKRCMEVQKVLQVSENNLTINPIGSKELLYNNDVPEGRSYSRTVRIIIETPVKD
jgi:outer membrane protein OmpA-like peptidoglycan-associated protein